MNNNSQLNREYADLSRLGRGEITAEALVEIKKALNGSRSLLISKAADIAADKSLNELIPAMITAFERLMAKGPASDKGCRAKTSIVKALNKLEHIGNAVFISGIHYVQMEASFGPPEDTAVDVRAESAFGLARINYPDVHFLLVDRLVDTEHIVRMAAARALAYLGDPEGELMLRLKVLCGDRVEVLGECFAGLLGMSPKRSLSFVARYLDSPDSLVIEAAAIAVGGTHLPEGLRYLTETWQSNPRSSVRSALLVPIALIRSDEAFEFILEILKDADLQTAADALSALSLYPGESYTEKIRSTVLKRNNPQILKSFQAGFG